MHRRCAAIVVSIAVLLAACTGTDDEAEQMEVLGIFTGEGDPLEYFEWHHREEARVQELIAACMAEQGFEYIEYLPSPSPDVAEGLTAAEYKQRYGWGMMASTEHTLLRHEPDRDSGDPNLELRSEMDEPTRVAWETAMYGPHEARDDPAQRVGCQAEAEYRVMAHADTDAWGELAPLLWEIPERVHADPRSVEARRNWSQCMAEAGYRFDDLDEAIHSIDVMLWEVWMEQTPPPGEPEHRGMNRMDPWFVGTDAWNEVVRYELDLAAADTACSQDPDLFGEYYERFLDDHQDLIQQLQAELAELSR